MEISVSSVMKAVAFSAAMFSAFCCAQAGEAENAYVSVTANDGEVYVHGCDFVIVPTDPFGDVVQQVVVTPQAEWQLDCPSSGNASVAPKNSFQYIVKGGENNSEDSVTGLVYVAKIELDETEVVLMRQESKTIHVSVWPEMARDDIEITVSAGVSSDSGQKLQSPFNRAVKASVPEGGVNRSEEAGESPATYVYTETVFDKYPVEDGLDKFDFSYDKHTGYLRLFNNIELDDLCPHADDIDVWIGPSLAKRTVKVKRRKFLDAPMRSMISGLKFNFNETFNPIGFAQERATSMAAQWYADSAPNVPKWQVDSFTSLFSSSVGSMCADIHEKLNLFPDAQQLTIPQLVVNESCSLGCKLHYTAVLSGGEIKFDPLPNVNLASWLEELSGGEFGSSSCKYDHSSAGVSLTATLNSAHGTFGVSASCSMDFGYTSSSGGHGETNFKFSIFANWTFD